MAVATAQADDERAPASPLERLRSRSAAERWDLVRGEWTAPDAPAGEDIEIAPEPRPLTEGASDPAPTPTTQPVQTRGLPVSDSESVEIRVAPRSPHSEKKRSATPPVEQEIAPGRRSPEIESQPGQLRLPDGRTTTALPQEPRRRASDSAAPPAPLNSPRRAPIVPQRPVALELFQDPEDSPDYPGSASVKQDTGLRPISEIEPFRDYSPDGKDACQILCPRPGDCEEDGDFICPPPYDFAPEGSTERLFPHLDYYWVASDLYHNPLYFEDPTLERYGHVHCHELLQPLDSMGRFGIRLLGLPYQMALDPVCRRSYALGWYRPGEPAPKLYYQIPWNAKAAATATGVYTGLIFLIP